MPLAAPLATWFNPRLARAVVLFALAGVPLAAGAASPMRPGLWEQSVSTVVGGERVPASSSKECISQGDIDQDTKTLPRPDGDCKLSNIVTQGNRTSYDMACRLDNLASRGRMDLVLAADSYDGTTEMSFTGAGKAEVSMTVVINGRRIGDCQK